ncbi:hypothetical protein L0F63_001260 [Massospora cicadina]|nr:hypothetical protein L0F63_001260 [Massospora cicadina]
MELEEPKTIDVPTESSEPEKQEPSKVSTSANEDEEEEDEEEVYVVEEIKDHKKDKNGYKYYIKWQGFTEADNTWEREENIFSKELLEKYWAKQPKGRDSAVKQQPAKKRKTQKDEDENKAHVEEVILDHAYPPEDLEDWESEVVEVETVERNAKGELTVYLIWYL